jgi:hypothetical protein
MTGERVPGGPIAGRPGVRAVSRPHDPQEHEADRAADVVIRGGTVAGWSFSNVPLAASSTVHRQEAPKPKGEDEKYKEAALKAGEAALETKEGKALKEQVLADPLVKTVTDAVSTTPGKVVAGAAIVGGVGALAATGQPLPFQAPAIPLDRITPGLSGKVTVDGPLNAPTFVGLTLTYKEQGPKTKTAKSDSIAADTARLRAQQEMFRPKSEKDAAKRAEQEMVDAWVRSQLPGLKAGVTIPLPTPTAPVEEKPVQRAPTSESAAPAHVHVEDALASTGRPLDPSTRRSMEARFGHDFSRVRLHDDALATNAAREVRAAAFTVGEDIVLGSAPGATRVLAHELAHVVQQRRETHGAPIQRYTAYSSDDQSRGNSNGWLHPGSGDMRVSDDGQMAVDDKGWNPGTNKRAWTTPAMIAASNAVLAAQGSLAALRAKPGGHAVSGSSPTGGAAAALTEMEPFKPGGGPFSLISDCGHACRQIIGSGPVGSRDVAVLRREARPGSAGTGGAVAGGILGFLGGAAAGAALGSLAGPLGAIAGGIVGGLAGLFGGSKLGRWLARRDPEEANEEYTSPQTYHAGPPSTPEEFSGELYKRELGGATREEALQRYAAMSEDERDKFDRHHGINRYARPRVGEGVTIGTEYKMPGYADPTANAWNFHYAATVLESGHDYMTLETAAGWGIADWIFYMYGPPSKRQSFHEEQAATGAHGTRQTSLVVLPEFRLDVRTTGPGTALRAASGAITLPAGQRLRVLERRTRTGGTEEVRVRVVGGPSDGVEGWVPAGAIR